MKLTDAHNHLHDSRLEPHLAKIFSSLTLECAVVNGTSERDWPAVAALAAKHAWIRPAFGLHPWFAGDRSPQWLENLRGFLDANSHASIGEIGLDGADQNTALADQVDVFSRQFALAAERNLAASIHCVRAWDSLSKLLKSAAFPSRGFLLHGFGGSLETMRAFANRGAYFSFPSKFTGAHFAKRHAVFAAIPADRLLVETDAPFSASPANQACRLIRADDGSQMNHPGNIEVAYVELAKIRGMNLETVAEIVAANFARLFGE